MYRPDPKEVVIEWELPPQSVIPLDRDYRYVATRDAIDAIPRAEKEIKELYRAVIAQVALRTIHEILVSTPGSVIDLVTFYGKVSATDPATGQPVQPLLLQVSAKREVFSTVRALRARPGGLPQAPQRLVLTAPVTTWSR